MKKCISLFFALVMVFALAACGAKGPPKTAAELVERSMALKDNNNRALSGNMKIQRSISASDDGRDIPMDIALDFKMADSNVHGTMKMSLAMADQSMDSTIEMYSTKDTVYVCADGGQWLKESVADTGVNITDLQRKLTATKYFKDAEMVYDQTAKTYTVTIKMAALLQDDAVKSLFDNMDLGKLLGDMDTQMTQDMLAAFGEGEIVFVFDDACHLTNMTIQNVKYEGDIATGTQTSGQVNITIEADLKYDNYGTIQADAVKVPSDVKDGAVELNGNFQGFGF